MDKIEGTILIFGQLMIISAFLFVVNCGLLKDIGRTANDAAMILCELVAAEKQQELQGLSPQQWCAIHENLRPFLDEVLSAQKAAAKKTGLSK